MAVVGSASIVVRAITTGVADDIKKGFAPATKQAEKSGQQFGQSYAKGAKKGFRGFNFDFGSLQSRATAALEKMKSLIRVFNIAGPAVAGLGSAIGALGGTLISLVGVVGKAIPAIGALGGAFATLGVAAIGAKAGLGNVFGAVAQATEANSGLGDSIRDIREELQQLKFDAEDAANAEKRAALELEVARENLARVQDLPPNSRARREAQLAYEEADLAYRRAKDRAADLQKDVEDGISPAAAAGNDPFAGLNESQKALAEYLITLKPLFEDLENEISKGFIPSLIKGFQKVEDEVLRTEDFKNAITNLGDALGDAAENFFNTLVDSGAGDNVIELLNSMSTAAPGEDSNIAKLGTILGNVFGIITEVLLALEPITTRFFDDMETGSTNMYNNLRNDEDNSLSTFFTEAYDTAERLFGIVGNLITGFRGLFTESEDGGETLLTYLERISTNFANLAGTPAGEELSGTINTATENGTLLLSLIGDILKGLLDLAAAPEFAEGITKLKESGPALSDLFDKLIKGFPGLAELIGNLIELINNVTVEGGIEAFFDTLNEIVGNINDFLSSVPVQNFLKAVSPIVQSFNAILLVGGLILNFVLLPILGVLFTILSPISMFLRFFGLANSQGAALKMIFGGIWKVLKGIGGFFVKALGFIQTFFLRLVLGPSKLLAILGRIGLFLTGPIGIAIGIVTAALTWFFTQTELGKEIWANFVEFFKGVIDTIVQFFVGLGENIAESWNRMVGKIGEAWDGFVEGFHNAVENIKSFFGTIFEAIGEFFRNWINGNITLVEGFVNFFIDGLNWIIDKANELEFEVPDWVPFIGGETLGVNLPNVPKLSLPRLAEGGIVSPRSGGQLVTVAEAGRPERVEPLDPDGLSKRDKALIAELSGGSGNTINVYGTPGMDTKELAEEVSRRIAFKVRKGTF